MTKKILITFDLEEFDLPLEYNLEISIDKQLEIGTNGLIILLEILKKHSIKATFFTTAFFAESRPQLIKKIVKDGHELASHLYYHSDYNIEHIASSKHKLEEISGKKIYGIRSPRLRPLSLEEIEKSGYIYSSSLNPTFIPGRYNNFKKPRTIFYNNNRNLFIVPFSVSPIIRFPLFWLSFKNLPLTIYSFLCNRTLKKDKYLHLYFHPWEFSDLEEFKIPNFIKKIHGQKMTKKFELFIKKIKNKGNFITIKEFLESNYNKK
ncbi:polysaccharide deacetylase family protein [Polaribacter atrinae]|uniref:Polysaccharide deacetylase n=1 Tax=Polaribacter atrinae TaxID=1333662 RepID=A0A176TBF6_9FLAO|nr:polysaccharide deacetylase family protein [Polaribacter atrinae]OAD44745.1 polysaccharide deacetylase [Polaribacter atrinae]